MSSTKAFITGASGQDGSLLAELLLAKGYVVYGLVREKSSIENLQDLIDNPNLHIIYGDSQNNDLLRFVLEKYQFDEIYNLASQSNVRLSYDSPILTFNVTLLGTLILLENIRKHSPNSRVFQAGSSAMFGNSTDPDGFQRETTPFFPVSPYASSKLFSHNICCNYRNNYGLYISNGILYNHESTKSKTLLGVLNTITKNAVDIKNKNTDKFHIPNINIRIDCGDAAEYVEAMWLTLQQQEPDDYIISTGVTHSLAEICDYVFSKLGLDWTQHITTDHHTSLTAFAKGDNCKIKNIGWNKDFNIHTLLDKLLNYYDTQPANTN